MAHRPAWRAPLGHGPKNPWQSPAFLAARAKVKPPPRCPRCSRFALRGAKFCRKHGGLLAAAAAEAERFGTPVMILRKPRYQAWFRLAKEMEWPEGLPKLPHLITLGLLGRGRLFEAWLNRNTDMAAFKHELTRPRHRYEMARPSKD